MTQPKVILFDVGGVLMHFYHIRDTMSQELGIDPKDFWPFMTALDLGRADGSITEKDVEEKIRAHFKLTHPPGFWSDMHWMYHFKPITEMHELAEELAKHYRVGVLTNVTKEAYETGRSIPGLWPDVVFDPLIRSDLVHLAKPDPKIYEVATQMSQCQPEEILFIDDMEVNITAAKAARWQTFHFNPADAAADAAKLRKLLLSS